MNDIYSRMKSELVSRRVDLTFKPEDLDKLTNEQREEIEKLIMDECKEGNSSSFKYLSKFKTINPIRELNMVNKISMMSPVDKASLYSNLLDYHIDLRILDMFYQVAKIDYNAYSLFLRFYKKLGDGSRIQHEVYRMIEYIQRKSNDPRYSELFHKFLGEDTISSEKNYIGPGLVLTSDLGDEENKKKIIANMLSLRDKLNREREASKPSIKDSLYGFIVGDAFGVPVEFQDREELQNNPVVDMLEYGTHHVPKGTWSDDTSMTLATMDSLSVNNGIDYNDMMERFVEWSSNAMYTATDTVFDIGITTRKALYNYYSNKNNPVGCGLDDVRSNGNGSLMRIMPVCFYLSNRRMNEDDKVNIINNISSLTHAHEISKMGCYIYNKFIDALLHGKDKNAAYNYICNRDYNRYYSKETIDVYKRILDGNLKSIDIKDISSSGYVVSTLESVLWTILNTDNYRDSIIKSVNLGNDTDTVAAITGSLAGLLYGIDNIPKEWLDAIPKKDYLDGLINNYDETILNKKNTKNITK